MCGIAGFWDAPDASERLTRALAVLAPRGQDAAGAWTQALGQRGALCTAATPADLPPLPAASVAIGHTLHAMVGCVPQPLVSQRGVLSVNCELYTWRARAQREGLTPDNDADLLHMLLDQLPLLDGPTVAAFLDSLDGTFAFVYERDGTVLVARDRLGVKPIWFSHAHGFSVASTRAALFAAGVLRPEELSPRSILLYDRVTRTVSVQRREFFAAPDVTEVGEPSNRLLEELRTQVHVAVLKRAPENHHTPTALFLGGGVDSAILAMVLSELPKEQQPRCYTVARAGSREARMAAAIASVAGLSHTIVKVTPASIAAVLPRVLAATDDANPVKVSVGIVTALASEAAASDGCLCAFSGTGADEAFAALARHQASTDRALEAIGSLRKLHERELTREDAIALSFGVELRLPFLDEAVIPCALRTLRSPLDVPAGEKRALRLVAESLGVPAVLAELPRKAPQYGSGVMHGLIALAKRSHARTVAEYLDHMRVAHDGATQDGSSKRVAVLLSGGKDSVLAAHILHGMRYTLACAVTIESDNPDSYLYHTPNTQAAALQAQAMRLPFITVRTHGEQELELAALQEALVRAKREHTIAGVVTGAIGSHYQRERIERLCDELSLTVYSPLWQMDQVAELKLLLAQRFDVRFVRVAAEGLDEGWLGTQLTDSRVLQLQQLQQRYGVHPAGEGGEYESLVLDAPLFHERLQIGRTEVIKDGSAATLHVHELTLVPKQSFAPLD